MDREGLERGSRPSSGAFPGQPSFPYLPGYTYYSHPYQSKPLYLYYSAVVTGIGLLLKGALWQP